MNDLRAMHGARDEWEDLSDGGDTISPINIREHDLYSHSKLSPRRSKSKQQSASKLQRLRSRKRQQHQNEKAGIRLVTDMERFRQGPQHVAQLVQPSSGPVSSKTNISKFADASALRALEGSPNLGSMGNWAWLKDNKSPATATPDSQHFSPDGNKIVIGMAMLEQDAAARTISPQTATIATPTNRFPDHPQPTQPANHHQKSAWSPDTDDGYSPAHYQQNIYGQLTGQSPAHPIPAIPSHLRNSTKANEVDDDDNFTPVTLFEEDGRKSPASAVSKISPETTRSHSGWWDHVKTPFKERFSPAAPTSPGEWWKGADTKATMPPQHTASDASSSAPRPIVPIIREPSPPTASSSRSSSPPASIREQQTGFSSEKGTVQHDDPSDVPPPYEHTPSSKQGGPYAVMFPPSQHYLTTHLPPAPGSPGPDGAAGALRLADMRMCDVPLTPARPTTGAQSMHSAAADAPLPDRVAGTYVGDHHAEVRGASPAAQIEKTRRRHEKEDYLARKVGGWGKGRACLTGCYGRSGREGRQRRRCWLMGCLVLLVLTIVGVVVGVVVSRDLRQRIAAAGGSTGSTPTESASDSSSTTFSPETTGSNTPEKTDTVWLNLTSFPPIPTGIATVVGPDNSEAISGCVAPETLWSCSLPPEEQAANKPSEPEEPMFIFQIQYANTTRQLWNIPNGDPPTSSTASSATTGSTTAAAASSTTKSTQTSSTSEAAARATLTDEGVDPSRRGLDRRDDTLYDAGIAPNPAPPSFEEMWFLGNWTDGIVSDDKAGEPTPFYISFFASLTDSAGPNMLTDDTNTTTKRQTPDLGSDPSSSSSSSSSSTSSAVSSGGSITDLLPAPLLNADGTGQAAQLRAFPFQQPLRLYDRGLPTEHYGFHSYFTKTIYAASMANTTTTSVASGGANEAGGVRETSAEWYAAWTQTRFVVKIWTRKQGAAASSARLIGAASGAGAEEKATTTSPGTFAYPVTIGEDTHGGDLQEKMTFAYKVEADGLVNATVATTFVNDIGFGGDVVNAAYPDGDLSWGGIDGGKGGCRCEWVNWVDAEGAADETFA